MDKKTSFNQIKAFNCIFFLTLIKATLSYLSFKFPFAFKLNNKNIFVINQLGVHICNHDYTKVINQVVTFSDSEKITTDEALSKVSSIYEDNYIICLINDKIYIFDDEGNFLKKSSDIITIYNVEYYSLTYIYKNNNYYYFVVGFVFNQELYLYSYKYDISQNLIEKYSQLECGNHYQIKNNGLSCHYMKYSSSYLLTCLYYVNNYGIVLDFFEVYSSALSVSTIKNPSNFSTYEEVKYIRGILSSDEETLTVGWMSIDGVPYYWQYDINNAIDKYECFYYSETFCKLIPHGFKYNYYQENSKFIWSCILDSNEWFDPNSTIFADSFYHYDDIEEYNTTYIFSNCDIHGYSMIYLDNEEQFYILSDAYCLNELISFKILPFEDLEEEEEEKEEEEEEKEKEKEEEKQEEKEEYKNQQLTENFSDYQSFNYKTNIIYKCSEEYFKLPSDKKQCFDICISSNKNKLELKNICYEINSKSLNRTDYCDNLCTEKSTIDFSDFQDFDTFCDINDDLSLVCTLVNNNEETNSQEEIEIQDKILKNVDKEFTSDNYHTDNLDKGKEEIIKYKKITISLTTTETQKNNFVKNMTAIDFTECEKILRLVYNISSNKKIYMKKMEVKQDNVKIPKIEYDIYYKVNDTKKIKLDLSFCKNSKIDLSVPLDIPKNENIDEYNSSSGYYNDICYVDKSNTNTDKIRKDKQKEYIENQKVSCQQYCEFTEYNYDLKKAKCRCNVMESSSSSADMIINGTQLYEIFKDVKNIVNINILICYKVLFTKEGIIHNIGFFIVTAIIILHLISMTIFYIKDLNKIKKTIKTITFGINHWDLIEAEVIKKKEETIRNTTKHSKTQRVKNSNILNANENKKKRLSSISKKEDKLIKQNKKLNRNGTNKTNNLKNKSKQDTSNAFLKKSEINKRTIIEKVKKIMEYNSRELNQLTYQLAIKYDQRTFSEYYISLIQTKHPLIFSFYSSKDYNSRIIKINLFFSSFVIYYFINTLFFSDNTMHKIYENKGKYKILYRLPQIVYSTLISYVLNALLKVLALSEELILEFKRNKSKKDVNRRKINLTNKLNIRFIFYFIINFIFVMFFWYYLSMFCAIYIHTQTHLIKDTLISFGSSLLYPLGLYLIPAFLRIPALSNKKNKRKYLYDLSKLFQRI